MVVGSKEAKWVRNLLYEMSIWPKPIAPIFIHCDNQSTLSKTYSQVYNEKSELDIFIYVNDLIANEVISIIFIRIERNCVVFLRINKGSDM